MGEMSSPPFVVADIVVRESNCNLSCTYCLTGQSNFKSEHSLLGIFAPPTKFDCGPQTELGRRLRSILRAPAEARTPVVKLSGGEFMLIEGSDELVEEIAPSYETVVLLTNGMPLTQTRCARLRSLGNIVLQVSIDATRHSGNSYRCPDEATHHAAMSRLHGILKSGIPTEIYLVLHDRSMPSLRDTLDDLMPYSGALTVFPFPVRGPDRSSFQPTPEQQRTLLEVVEHASRWEGLLPGTPYLERLRRFYVDAGRRFSCHLPRVAFTAFDDGVVTNCPNIWFNHADNLLQKPVAEVYRTLTDAPFRRLLLAPAPRIDACRGCYTPWDPVSLYFEDQLSLQELGRIPMYRGPRTLDALAAAKAALGPHHRASTATAPGLDS